MRDDFPVTRPVIFFLGVILGILVLGGLLSGFGMMKNDFNDKIISNQTASDICHNFTNDSSVIASAKDGKLICTLPNFSFDHTPNIVIKKGDGK